MEFDLHIVTNGNRANISMDYSSKENIDVEKLKKAINDVVDCLVIHTNSDDFVQNNEILLKDNNVTNLTQPNYIVTPKPLEKYSGENLIQGAILEKEDEEPNNSITSKNDDSYLQYIVISKIQYDIA